MALAPQGPALMARVSSGLLPFPNVTLTAIGQGEAPGKSGLRGKLAPGGSGLACLTCGPQLEVINTSTGQRSSAYQFRTVKGKPAVILAIEEFLWEQKTGFLLGLEDRQGSTLCLYDIGISKVVKAVAISARVTAIEPLSNEGGPTIATHHLHPSLRWLFGVVAVVTDVGQILLIDLCLDELPGRQTGLSASLLQVLTGIPEDVPDRRDRARQEGHHLGFQLVGPSGTAISTLAYLKRTNQLAVGFADGSLALWNMKSMTRDYYTQLKGGRVPISAVTFQEHENDPQNVCYLWAVQSTQDSQRHVLSLHLLRLAFGNKKCLASGQSLYEGLECCEERYTLDLTEGIFPLTGQTHTKLLGCQSIVKFLSQDAREEGRNEVQSPDTSVSIFTWQVSTYGQGKPSAYLGIFDINSWYRAQMPDALKSGEDLHNCSYFVLWSLDCVVSRTFPHDILDILVHERSLSREIPPSYPPPEQLFNPSSLKLDATCLLNSGVVHITCNSFQKNNLSFLKKLRPTLNEVIPDSYNHCLLADLSPDLIDIQLSNVSQQDLLEALWSAAVQTSSLGLLTGYIKKWIHTHTSEGSNSAAKLSFVLEWTWNKVVATKAELDRLCVPLFDGSCHLIDPQTIQSFQRCHLLLSNLHTVLRCLKAEAKRITGTVLVDLSKKCTVTQLRCQYIRVLLWFCHAGFVPEGLDDDIQLPSFCYNYHVIQSYYDRSRQKNPDCLMIDGMVSQVANRIENLWKQDKGGTGNYPPPSVYTLLDIYLLDNVTEVNKHAMTIYFISDLTYFFQNKTDTPIESFRKFFAISYSQVKLIEGLWLVDHDNFDAALELLFHPATVKPSLWQHTKFIQASMSQGEHRIALQYMKKMNVSVSTDIDIKLHINILILNRYVVEAWSLLRQHSKSLNRKDLLKHIYELCQEMGLMKDLLKLPLTVTDKECLVRFLQSSDSVQNQEFLLVHHLQHAEYISALKLNRTLNKNLTNNHDPHLRERSVARNSMLAKYEKMIPRVHQAIAMEGSKAYSPSTSILQFGSRPKPLSASLKPTVKGTELSRSDVLNLVLSKVEEVSENSDPEPSTSLYDYPKVKVSYPRVYYLPQSRRPISQATKTTARPLRMVVFPVPRPWPGLRFIRQSLNKSHLDLAPYSLPASPDPGVSFTIPILSKRKLDQERALNLMDKETEMKILNEIFALPKEKFPLSDIPPDSGEIHVPGHEKLEIPGSGQEASVLSCTNMHPSGTVEPRHEVDAIEQQICDLFEKLSMVQSTSNLIIEGEGENETGDSAASIVLAKASNTAVEKNQEHSAMDNNHGSFASLSPFTDNGIESSTVEAVAKLLEQMIIATGEYILGASKDRDSPGLTSDIVEQPIQKCAPVVIQKVRCSTNLVKATSINVQKSRAISLSPTNDTNSSGTRADIVKQPIQKCTPVVIQKVRCSTNLVKATSINVQKSRAIILSPTNDTISSGTRAKERVQNLNVKSARSKSSANETANKIQRSSAIKKMTKHSGGSERTFSDKELSPNQQIPQKTDIFRRGIRRKMTPDSSESSSAMQLVLPMMSESESKRSKSSLPLKPAIKTSFKNEKDNSLVATKMSREIKRPPPVSKTPAVSSSVTLRKRREPRAINPEDVTRLGYEDRGPKRRKVHRIQKGSTRMQLRSRKNTTATRKNTGAVNTRVTITGATNTPGKKRALEKSMAKDPEMILKKKFKRD